MHQTTTAPYVAIACGGTGGHLFPGLAVAEELIRRDCSVSLLISPKEVDQHAVKSAAGMEVIILPAVALTSGRFLHFAAGFWKSYRQAKQLFQKRRPEAVLAMGGFTSAPPTLAGKHLGAKTFLHESNSIPGRANRWLTHVVEEAFVYFHETSGRLNMQRIHVTGMPVRSSFLELPDVTSARISLGLSAKEPVLLVMGGSQGASGINDLIVKALPVLAQRLPHLQYLHLTGPNDVEKVQAAYAAKKLKAVVRPFLTEMDLGLAAATAAVSRAGASSLAEIAAVRLPAVLIPYPYAADDHQYYNALAFVESGAAKMAEQFSATPEFLADEIAELIANQDTRADMQRALVQWHIPNAAEKIADLMFAAMARDVGKKATMPSDSAVRSGQSRSHERSHRMREEANV